MALVFSLMDMHIKTAVLLSVQFCLILNIAVGRIGYYPDSWKNTTDAKQWSESTGSIGMLKMNGTLNGTLILMAAKMLHFKSTKSKYTR